ncbi:MAG TPA: peptidylprolyl isomerase [Candidatus Deferrimicrobium sp.]|nr:peptidylprolyl isomerase [Candidatus Deferrimicrobium sp.]
MKRTTRALLSVSVAAAVAIGCGASFINEGNLDRHKYIVVQADDVYALTVRDLYDRLNNSKVLAQGGILSPQQVKAFLDSVLVDTLLTLRAATLDLSEHYEYCRIYRQRYLQYLTTRYLEETVSKKVAVDSFEVVDFYNSRPDLFSVAAQVRVRQILSSPYGLLNGADSLYYRTLTTEQLAEETRRYAYQVRRALDLGEPFADAVRRFSHDLFSRDRDGLYDWVQRGVYLDPFDSIAFSMKPGEISQPYHDQAGWHILFLESRIDSGIPPLGEPQFEMARSALLNSKAGKIASPLRDSLFAQIRLVFHEELLDTNAYLVPKSLWAAIVNDQDTIDFNEMRSLEEDFRSKYQVDNTTVEMKKQMLRRIAERYVFAQAARAVRIDTLPDVRKEEASLRSKYARDIVRRQYSDPTWDPPDSLVERYFRNHRAEFENKRGLRIQHIILDDSLFAEFVRDQALSGVDFMELAQEYYPGESSIRADLANLGEVTRQDIPQALYDVALSTPVGSVSYPVRTEYGYHIIKVLTRPETISAETVRSKIEPILKDEHERRLLNRLRDSLYDQYRVRFPHIIYPIHLRPLAARRP